MKVKSEDIKKSKLKEFITAVENGEPIPIISFVVGIALLVILGVKTPSFLEKYDNYSQYNDIVENKPLMRCGNHIDDMLTSDNYQAFTVDGKGIIRVHYSKDSFRDFLPSECKIIAFDLNGDIEKNKIRETVSALISKNEKLKDTVKDKTKTIERVKREKENLIADYKLPSFEELDKLYTKFRKEKRKDFDAWVASVKRKELAKLEKARQEYASHSRQETTDDCYTEAIDSSDPAAYDYWSNGECEKVRKLSLGK